LNSATTGGSEPVGYFSLGLNGRFVDKHNRNVILHRVNAVALGTLQAFRILAVFEGLLVGGANQNFEKILSDHAWGIVRQNELISDYRFVKPNLIAQQSLHLQAKTVNSPKLRHEIVYRESV
jgi:hypothetical protein